eukprot:2523494-Prymnesium_polylepis.1
MKANLQRCTYGINEEHDKRVWHERAIQLRLRLNRPVVGHHREAVLTRAVESLAHKEHEDCRRSAGIDEEPDEEADIRHEIRNDEADLFASALTRLLLGAHPQNHRHQVEHSHQYCNPREERTNGVSHAGTVDVAV